MREKVTLHASSLGQKLLVGLTGIFLCTFLVVHLSGNMLLFRNDGGEAFDRYSTFMSTNPAIRTLEIALFAGFALHVVFAARTWLRNRRARPERYQETRPGENTQLASRIMGLTGSITFLFLVVHLRSFFVPARFSEGDHPSMYELVREAFASPVYSGFYVLALGVLAFHLRHGFQSAFQTFGIRPATRRLVDAVAVLFWLVIPIGFAAMPIYFLWARYRGI